ncbi:hypothetical protein EYF80_026129 [Liparis tanakae]|uniref:Uncharacterized protein n=1 Tax=Liparis tanakae TaxID=230148 RepID=A0A4Z2HF33_9TELE|nr:hypothetical protein EYF80_026129 [Liparis tanakae]
MSMGIGSVLGKHTHRQAMERCLSEEADLSRWGFSTTSRIPLEVISCSATAQRWSYRNDGDDANRPSSPKKCFKTNMAAT